MEKVTVQEAALRLHVSQDVVRRRIRNGELKAYRELGPHGYAWMVELPENSQTDENSYLREQARLVTPWWWTNAEKIGKVHYVEGVETEEVIAHHLCGLVSQGIWNALDHSESDRCPKCVTVAKERGLPLDGTTSLITGMESAKIWDLR